MLDVILSGLVSASLYAIAGLGLGVVYRATKVLNFAMGGFGALATYAAYNLIGHGAPYWLVFVTAIAVGAAIGGLAELGVNRRLARLSPLTITMGSLGLLLVLEGAVGTWYDYSTRALPPMLGSETALRIGSSSLSANQVAIIVVAVIVAVALALLTNRTRYGLAMRAVSSGPHTSELLGVDVTRVRLGAWVLGGVCGAIAAMLVTPLTYLSPGSFASFMLSAFTAAVLGGFNRIRGLIVGALVFGVGLNLLESYLSTRLTNTYMFVVIALVLLIRPSGVFGGREREVAEVSSAQAAPAPARELPVARRASTIRGAGWVLVGVAFVVCPYVLAEPHVYLLALALSTFIAVAGLNVITGYTGQVSVGHSGFLAVGAYAAAVAGSHASVPIGLLLPIALVAGAVVGVVVGLPATRLRGVYLALFTLVFSFMVPELVLWFGRYTGGPNGLALSPPAFAYGVRGLYWFTLAIATAVALILMVAQRGRIGRGWRAVRDSEDGARAAGIGPTTVKVAAFAFGSALAGLSGALSGMQVGIVSPQGYDVLISIYMLLAVILGGSSSIFGSLLGALFITLVPTYSSDIGVSTDLLFGAAMLVALLVAPRGLAGALDTLLQRALSFSGRRTTAPEPEPAPATASVVVPSQRVDSDSEPPSALLEVRGVYAGYGMVEVLRGVSLSVAKGEIVAVLGANGAGKSTLLRTISGSLTPTTGDVRWQGHPLGRRPHATARLGLAHVPEGRGIFPDLTVSENLTMGYFGVGGRTGQEHDVDWDGTLALFPRLRERLRRPAGTLSGGEQQMLAIARGLLSRPELLMLDEPSLGLAPVVTQQVFAVLRTIAEAGVSILIVEQNARAAMNLADRGYVISAGRIAISGAAADLRDDQQLARTYLEMS